MAIWYKSKDLAYIKEQNRLSFDAAYPTLQVQFVDPATVVDGDFGSQKRITLLDPVDIPILLQFDDLASIKDDLGLSEEPEAVATFSKPWLDFSDIPDNEKVVQPDCLILSNALTWRISKVTRQDYIYNNPDDFLHYLCVLERTTRHNYTNEQI